MKSVAKIQMVLRVVLSSVVHLKTIHGILSLPRPRPLYENRQQAALDADARLSNDMTKTSLRPFWCGIAFFSITPGTAGLL